MIEHPPALRRHFAALTSLRLVAAMAVVLLHFFALSGSHPPVGDAAAAEAARPVRGAILAAMPWLSQGHLAVDFFFVLSGFVLAHAYAAAWEGGTFRYGRFLRRRVARIYPLHLATLLAFVAVVAAARLAGAQVDVNGYDFASVPSHLLLVHAWGVEQWMTFNGPSWSISAEWLAYLLFPVAAWAVWKPRPPVAAAAAVGWFLGCDWLFSSPGHPMTSRAVDFGALRIIAEFPLGVALWRVLRWQADGGRPRWSGAAALWGGAAGSLVSASLAWPPAVTVLGLAAVVYGTAAVEQAGGLRWLQNRWLVYGGEISYSVYMTHALIQVFLEKAARSGRLGDVAVATDTLMLVGVPVTLLASHLAYRLIEVPGRRWVIGQGGRRGDTADNHTAVLDGPATTAFHAPAPTATA